MKIMVHPHAQWTGEGKLLPSRLSTPVAPAAPRTPSVRFASQADGLQSYWEKLWSNVWQWWHTLRQGPAQVLQVAKQYEEQHVLTPEGRVEVYQAQIQHLLKTNPAAANLFQTLTQEHSLPTLGDENLPHRVAQFMQDHQNLRKTPPTVFPTPAEMFRVSCDEFESGEPTAQFQALRFFIASFLNKALAKHYPAFFIQHDAKNFHVFKQQSDTGLDQYKGDFVPPATYYLALLQDMCECHPQIEGHLYNLLKYDDPSKLIAAAAHEGALKYARELAFPNDSPQNSAEQRQRVDALTSLSMLRPFARYKGALHFAEKVRAQREMLIDCAFTYFPHSNPLPEAPSPEKSSPIQADHTPPNI